MRSAFAYDVLVTHGKNTIHGANISLTPIGGIDPSKSYIWFGPFGSATGPSPGVYMPEGRHTVTYYVDDGNTFVDKQSFDVMISNGLSYVKSESGSNNVQLTWPSNSNATRYEVYRSYAMIGPQSPNPDQFTKIAEVAPGKKTTTQYTDRTVVNGDYYAYIIGELLDGSWKYSSAVGATPRKRGIYNYARICHPHQKTATAGVPYSYDITPTPGGGTTVINQNIDQDLINLLSSPEGMTIDEYGRIQWIPQAIGSYSVEYQYYRFDNGWAVDNFTINVGSYPAPVTVALSADPLSVNTGEATHLTWNSSYAEKVSIDQGIGAVSTSGEVDATIQNDTTFTISGSVLGATVTNSATVKAGPSVSIQASPQTIPSGGTSYLTWTSTNADTVTIDQGIGTVALNSTGQGLPVSPSDTTTYTITATGPGGEISQQATVTVIPPPTATFSADPITIAPEGSSNLSWTTSNADTVSIDNGVGDVAFNDSTIVSPTATTTYTISVTGGGGTTTRQVTVIVVPLPTVNLSANLQSILSGESSTLTWSSTNADTVSIDNGIGDVALNDSLPVIPTVTTTYTITATGTGGTSTAQAVVTVIPPPTVNFSADPLSIMIGESSTLTWDTSNADAVSIDQGVGTVALDGSTPVSPIETTTYTITATGPAGTTNQTVTIDVSPIHLAITSPAANSIVERPDVMVQGTLNNNSALETGVVVNGVVAIIDGNQFTANHVPLDPGENTITVVATDISGNTSALSQTVTCEVPPNYITIGADYESGIIPLDTIISISASFEFSTSNISFSGPANIEFVSSTSDQYTIRITTPGVYYFTAQVTDDQSTVHSDTMAIEVLDPTALNALLSAKWNGIKTSLAGSDVNGALGYISQDAQSMFEYNFNLLIDHLPEMAAGLNDISLSLLSKINSNPDL